MGLKMYRCLSLEIAAIIAIAGLSSAASAWNPNAGAPPTSAYINPQSNLSNSVVPSRYDSNQGLNPLPATTTYVPQPAYATAPVNNYPTPPQARIQPVANSVIAPPPQAPTGYAAYQPLNGVPVAPAPAPVSNSAAYPASAPLVQPAPIQYAPAPIQPDPVAIQALPDPIAENNLMRSSAATSRRTHYSVGAEVFYDNYQEPETFPDLHNEAYYGSLTGSVTYNITTRWFAGLDGRASYGSQDYSSDSGTIENVPQLELESRVIAGYHGLFGTRLKPYIGLGVRYYLDQSEGEVTNLGAAGYDRSILQFYAPIGASYAFESDGISIIPTFEIDPLLYGTVESRLGSIPGYSNANNTQTKGIGWRAEVMISQRYKDGNGWQFGPFIRYWDIADSDEDTINTPSGLRGAMEPQNTRLQLGTKFKYLF
jgi:hypothetical protein